MLSSDASHHIIVPSPSNLDPRFETKEQRWSLPTLGITRQSFEKLFEMKVVVPSIVTRFAQPLRIVNQFTRPKARGVGAPIRQIQQIQQIHPQSQVVNHKLLHWFGHSWKILEDQKILEIKGSNRKTGNLKIIEKMA